ncbi:MAG: AAA family ATPase [Victivallaceae bacterium]
MTQHNNLPTFTVQEGYGKSHEYVMDGNQVVVGRDSECNIVITKSDASRKHARIFRDGNRFILEDLKSVNGTFVNSTPIADKCEIKHMDIIQIGSCMLVFNDPDNPSKLDAENTKTKTLDVNFSFDFIKYVVKKLEENIGRVFKGKPEVIRNVVVCLFADGHLLIEDAPGVGKSMLAQTLAKSIQANYKRIQFTPDMLPSDITGMNIYDETTKEFKFMPGPIFGNVILADEINRTTPRTQSSLLECMSESVITIDGKPHVLPKPFFVIATQNPDDYHGTYPLPEPQLDRFLMRLSIGYPDAAAEKEILESQITSHPLNEISYVIKAMDVVRCHSLVRKILTSDAIKEYIVKISNETRKHPALTNGCSPRASLALMRSSQSLAAYYGRNYVIPRDVREMVKPVLAHRVRLKLRYQGEWSSSEKVLDSIIESIPMSNEDKNL